MLITPSRNSKGATAATAAAAQSPHALLACRLLSASLLVDYCPPANHMLLMMVQEAWRQPSGGASSPVVSCPGAMQAQHHPPSLDLCPCQAAPTSAMHVHFACSVLRWYLLVFYTIKSSRVGVLVQETQALLDDTTPSCPAMLRDYSSTALLAHRLLPNAFRRAACASTVLGCQPQTLCVRRQS
jgi:hypothetical protein